MTKLSNILSVEEIVKLQEAKEAAKRLETPEVLAQRNIALINEIADENTAEIENNIELDLDIAIQNALDDFENAIFLAFDEAVKAQLDKSKEVARRRRTNSKYVLNRAKEIKAVRVAKTSKRELGIVTPKAPQNSTVRKAVIKSNRDNAKTIINKIAKVNDIPKYVKAVRDLAIAKAEAKVKVTEVKALKLFTFKSNTFLASSRSAHIFSYEAIASCKESFASNN